MNENINESEIVVRFNEVDQIGIAHHSYYLIWFEVARFQFAARVLQMTFEDFRNYDIYLPIVKIHCKIYESAKMGDRLLVAVHCENPNKNMINFFYETFQKGTIKKRIAVGLTTHVWTNIKGKVIGQFPNALQDKIDEAVKKYPFCFLDSKQARQREGKII